MTLEEIRGLLEKATPGPWVLNRHGYEAVYSPHEFIEAPDEGAICGVWDPDGHPFQSANAALIAAAPELAALLVRAVEEIADLANLAEAAMQEANNDGADYNIPGDLASARSLLRELGVGE